MNASISAARIEPIALHHAEAMLRWMGDPEVRRNIGLRGEPSLEKTIGWIEKAVADDSMSAFAIVCDGRHVGNVVLDQIDSHLSNARFSIYIGESGLRGRGVGQAATRLALKHAFEDLRLHKVWLTVHCHNANALRVYENCGFRMEGTLRDEFLLDGRLVDAHRMSILAAEFEKIGRQRGEAA